MSIVPLQQAYEIVAALRLEQVRYGPMQSFLGLTLRLACSLDTILKVRANRNQPTGSEGAYSDQNVTSPHR